MTMPFTERMIAEIAGSPMLAGINQLTKRLVGVGVTLVVRRHGEPFEFRPAGTAPAVPDFCRLIVGDGQGQRRCMMCHALVAVAPLERNVAACACHSGVCMIVSPLPFLRDEGFDELLLSTAAFKRGASASGWRHTAKCLRGLGVDRRALKATYDTLPVLNGPNLELALTLMACANHAIAEVGKRVLLEERLRKFQAAGSRRAPPETTVEDEIRSALVLTDADARVGASAVSLPPLVRVASEVVARNPSLPFTVAAVARAERISPNYFSNLFHRHMGQSFKHFLDAARLTRAEELLRNIGLSVHEVAALAGFESPGYFSRWFKSKRHMTPGGWRRRL